MPIQTIANNYPTIGWVFYGLSGLISTEIAATIDPIVNYIATDPIISTEFTLEEVHQITATFAMACLAFKFLSAGISSLMQQFRKNRHQDFEEKRTRERRKDEG